MYSWHKHSNAQGVAISSLVGHVANHITSKAITHLLTHAQGHSPIRYLFFVNTKRLKLLSCCAFGTQVKTRSQPTLVLLLVLLVVFSFLQYFFVQYSCI